uniref:RJL family GTPase n=1 Tax=Hanusia phi TaxID=3032 RepID=A0A7S0ELM2_9CRYP|mmetsp:Transcript_26508/g.60389  ORF Transcript_26508/g.60389 Transcript_26508/m.60389 type:complete len:213 (+) Transcript_26508:402-1040(+)
MLSCHFLPLLQLLLSSCSCSSFCSCTSSSQAFLGMDRSSITVPKPPKRNVIRIKIISMGDAGCGKSCLIKRYCEEKFVSKYISTIGVDYGVKSVVVNNQQVKANFWDLAGGPEYFDVRNEFYRDAQGAILVFDVSNRSSFEALEAWVQEAYKHGAKDLQIAVCGNKCDSKSREVKPKEAQAWANKNGYLYFETSANRLKGVVVVEENGCGCI